MAQKKEPDPYAELGVERDATEAEIKKAYRARSKETHPDRGGSADEFQRTARALVILTDPKKRKQYDETGTVEEDQPDNDRAVALGIIERFLGPIVNEFIQSGFNPHNDARHKDVLKMVAARIRNDMAEVRNGIANGERVVAYQKDFIARLRRKKGAEGEDFVRRNLELQVERAERQVAEMKGYIPHRELALKILEDYEFDRAPPPPQEQGSGVTMTFMKLG